MTGPTTCTEHYTCPNCGKPDGRHLLGCSGPITRADPAQHKANAVPFAKPDASIREIGEPEAGDDATAPFPKLRQRLYDTRQQLAAAQAEVERLREDNRQLRGDVEVGKLSQQSADWFAQRHDLVLMPLIAQLADALREVEEIDLPFHVAAKIMDALAAVDAQGRT